jgi:large subunit ribosomal protein L6
LFYFIKDRTRDRDSVLTQATLFRNCFIGISRKFRLDLWLKGVGFKFKLKKVNFPAQKVAELTLSLGYSHTLRFAIPKGCSVSLIGKKKIFFNSICYQELTQLVSYVQNFKLPDPYKGKGLNYKYKIKVIKPGKTK